ncbi:MAG: ribbon-helix-helix domain-containing protein [Alphaproteobacteria bacterium]|nr:ribbon-helix-helix domain-containing protein [Alphaproteobacteria bacterium]
MIRKHSITIRGHRTSVSLEDEFWQFLRQIADRKNQTVAALLTEIDELRRPQDNLSSAARVFVLQWVVSGGQSGSDRRP